MKTSLGGQAGAQWPASQRSMLVQCAHPCETTSLFVGDTTLSLGRPERTADDTALVATEALARRASQPEAGRASSRTS
jgi:hypothetical protein